MLRSHYALKSKDVLVLGHPRCGTGYMSKLLQAAGLDVGHEKVGKDGISCWTFAVPNESWFVSWEGVRSEHNWNYVIHGVRNPKDALESIMLTEDTGQSFQFRKKYLNIDTSLSPLSQSIQSFIGWNDMISNLQPDLTVRVEDAVQEVEDFLVGKGLSIGVDRSKLPNKSYNSRKYGKIPDSEKEKVPYGLRLALNNWCETYGYPKYFK